jgi:exonuclease VII small subunit
LSRFCTKKLDEAERKVETLLAHEGGLELKSFSTESGNDE